MRLLALLCLLLFVLPLSSAQARRLGRAAPLPSTAIPPGAPITANLPPGCRIQVFPPLPSGSGQFMVHTCQTDLRALIDARGSGGIRFIAVMNVGGGSWYVLTTMTSPGLSLDASLRDNELILKAASISEREPIQNPVLPLADLFAGNTPAETPPPVHTPVLFLRGSALASAFDEHPFNPVLPLIPGGTTQPDSDEIIHARLAWLEAQDPTTRAQALFELGRAYLDVGFFRESNYYFRLLSQDPGEQPLWLVDLVRARSAIGIERWEEARASLQSSFEQGAPANLVIEQLALISSATGLPRRAATGRMLAATTLRPESRLLAAELLQQEDAFQESLTILADQPASLEEPLLVGWRLRLGDAFLALGDIQAAERAYAEIGTDRGLLRGYIAEVNGRQASRWTELLPKIEEISLDHNPTSAEALFLLGQIRHALWDISGAMDAHVDLLRRFPREARSSSSREMLWNLYRTRVQELAAKERWLEIAVLHKEAWSSALSEVVRDPAPLEEVARAFEMLGLPDEALDVLVEAFEVLIRENLEKSNLPFHLARILSTSGHHQEALESLAWFEKHGVPEEIRGPKALLTASIYDQLGKPELASAALRQAAQYPDSKDEAALQFALIDARAGRCKEAIPSLWSQLMPEQRRQRAVPAAPYLTLARCLLTESRYPEAAEVARVAAARASLPEQAHDAGVLAASAEQGPLNGTDQDPPVPPEPDIWSRITRENSEARSFADFIQRYR